MSQTLALPGQPAQQPGMIPQGPGSPPQPVQALQPDNLASAGFGGNGPVLSGGLPGPIPVPQDATPNPAFAKWMQAYQQQQGIIAENAKRTAQFTASCGLIRKDGIRGFKLDIEADSTIAPDEQAEKMARVEFLQQLVPLIQQVSPIAQGNPSMAEFASEVVMFAIRGFRVARTLEESAENAFKVLGQMPPPAPKGAGKQENPELEQAKIAAQVHDTATQSQSAQAVAAAKAQTDQLSIAQKAQAASMQYQSNQERAAAQRENDQTEAAIEIAKLQSAERIASTHAAVTGLRGME